MGDDTTGGQPSDGPTLHPYVAQRVEEERLRLPSFADSRNKEPAQDVAREPFTFIPPVVREVVQELPAVVEATPMLRARMSRGPVSQQDCFGPMWETWCRLSPI